VMAAVDVDMAADRVSPVAAGAAALSLHVLRCPSSPLCCGHQGEDCRPTQLGDRRLCPKP